MTGQEERMLNRLTAGARTGACACGGFLASQGALHRSQIYNALIFERLQRKIQTLDELYAEADQNWNQTFYLHYFRTLGDQRNQLAFLELARRVPYKNVLRERLAPHAVEAMLLGASGLLQLYCHDTYTLDLGRTFEYLKAKYDICPMEIEAWSLANIRPANHPVLRIVQAAEFFTQDEFVMDRAMACRSEGDVQRLFCIEASEYWRTHHIPGSASDERPKRIGLFKANVIGINLVAVLQFAYASFTGNDRLRDSALTLLEKLASEENHIITRWRNAGIAPRNAFESQALLQLSTRYCDCDEPRCAECPVGRRILKSLAEG